MTTSPDPVREALAQRLRLLAAEAWPFAEMYSNTGKPETDNNFGKVATAMREAADLLSSPPPKSRDEVVEECARVADGLDGHGGGYAEYPAGWDHACSTIASTIRSLKSP